MTSCILSALSAHFSSTLCAQNQPDTLALQLSFLRRTSIGPATIIISEVKLGRATSNVHIRLRSNLRSNDKKEKKDKNNKNGNSNSNDDGPIDEVIGHAIQTNFAAQTGLTLATNWRLLPPPAPVQLEALRRGTDLHWVTVEDMPFPEFRQASTHVQFNLPRLGQPERSIVDEWLHLRNGERFKTTDLGYVADMFPQVVEAFFGDVYGVKRRVEANSHEENADENENEIKKEKVERKEMKRKEKPEWTEKRNEPDIKNDQGNDHQAIVQGLWYPTLMLNLEIKKALPPTGAEWLFVRMRARQIRNGRMDLQVTILDEAGELVALSSHVAMVLSAARNTGGRTVKL